MQLEKPFKETINFLKKRIKAHNVQEFNIDH